MLDASLPSLLARATGRAARHVRSASCSGSRTGSRASIGTIDFRLERVLDHADRRDAEASRIRRCCAPARSSPRRSTSGSLARRRRGARPGHGLRRLRAVRGAPRAPRRRRGHQPRAPCAARALNALLNRPRGSASTSAQGDLFAPRRGRALRPRAVQSAVPRRRAEGRTATRLGARATSPRASRPASATHLKPGGAALVLLSSFGDACALLRSGAARARLSARGVRAAPLHQRDGDDPARDAARRRRA